LSPVRSSWCVCSKLSAAVSASLRGSERAATIAPRGACHDHQFVFDHRLAEGLDVVVPAPAPEVVQTPFPLGEQVGACPAVNGTVDAATAQ